MTIDAPPPPYPFIGPIQTPPAPLPIDVALKEVGLASGARVIALQIATPAGVQFYFFEKEQAVQLGRALTQAGGGIEVVANGSGLARMLAERGGK